MNNTCMLYEAFLEYVKKNIGQYLEEYPSVCVSVETAVKNNGMILKGLHIRPKEIRLYPVIYMEGYYEQYISGEWGIEEVMNDVAAFYRREIKKGASRLSKRFEEFEKARDYIVFRLINYDKNKEQLEEIPYTKIMDLALTYRLILGKEKDNMTSMVVSKTLMSYWEISEAELYDLALENSRRLFPYRILTMESLIDSFMTDIPEEEKLLWQAVFEEEEEWTSPKMYVLTNEARLNGATTLFYTDALRSFASEHACDIFVLPSSVHEAILIRADECQNDERELKNIVCDANKSVVSEDEFLSDHVYIYRWKEEKLMIFDTYEEN